MEWYNICAALLVMMALIIIGANIHYYRERQHMTPEQKKQADEERDRESALW